MAMETEIFLQRTEQLCSLISAMKSMETSPSVQLTNIEIKLKNLYDLVKQDNCLNAGGKFEWVDSVLVKVNLRMKFKKIYDRFLLLMMAVNICVFIDSACEMERGF